MTQYLSWLEHGLSGSTRLEHGRPFARLRVGVSSCVIVVLFIPFHLISFRLVTFRLTKLAHVQFRLNLNVIFINNRNSTICNPKPLPSCGDCRLDPLQ